MSISETFAGSLTFVRIVALGLAVIAIGMSASAYHDDSMFSNWLHDKNESGFNQTEIDAWDRSDTLFEEIFIGGLCTVTAVGGIHLLLGIYIEKVEFSIWSVPFLAFCGIFTLAISELEIHSTVRYEAQIKGKHPCLSQSYRLKPEIFYHLCQETASKAFAASFAIIVGLLRGVQAAMDWHKIKLYRKQKAEEAETESDAADCQRRHTPLYSEGCSHS